METFNGESNWTLTARRDPDGVTLLRCRTCDKRAALPDTLWGVPVVGLGARAMSPDAPEVAGEQVRIACGAGAGAWDNQSLEALRLPPGLRRVGDYALYNCRALSRLCLWDSVTRWGSGVLVNCRSLERVEIVRPDADGGALAYFAGELNRELDVTVSRTESEPLFRLIFPEFRETYEENCPAHHFDYVIEGVGYPYHHCFRERRLHFSEYDALWRKSCGVMDTDTAYRLAWWRVRYPEELSDTACQAYTAFLGEHFREVAAWRLSERDSAGLAFLVRRTSPGRDALSDVCAAAREQGQTEAVAFLSDEQRKRFSVRDKSRFAL